MKLSASTTALPRRLGREVRFIPPLAVRAFGSYFGTIATYPVLLGFYLLVGYLYREFLISARVADLGPFLEQVFFLLLLVIPVLCMRLISEEIRSGSIDLLYVREISPVTIVLSKYLAAVAFSFVALVIPIGMATSAVLWFGSPDKGQLTAQLIGLGLVTVMLCALSVGTSAVVSNALVAAVLGEVVGLFLWFSTNAGSGAVQNVFALRPHLAGFTAGELALQDVIYLAALLASGLSVGVTALRLRRG